MAEQTQAIESLRRLRRTGGKKASIMDANKWFKQAIKTSKNKAAIGSKSNRILVGNMYIMGYDAKHKATLPYYDARPLIIPIEIYSDSILSLNLHYLPAKERLILFEALLKLKRRTLTLKGSRSRLRATYNILKSASKYRGYKACIKKHLYSHIKGQPIMIPEEDWHYAVLLPTQKFVGASRSEVYKDSLRMIR